MFRSVACDGGAWEIGIDMDNRVIREIAGRLKIAAVIPTYNNGKTVAGVIADVKKYVADIIVVNDGSTDGTSEILAADDSIILISHASNRGKGGALKTGLTEALKRGFEYALTIDSDGQHFASDIVSFVRETEVSPGALLVGSRNIEAENMPGKNTFANKFSNFWYRLETGIRLSDTQSGYRLYPLGRLDFSRWWYTDKYEFELEALVFAAWNGMEVKNIPVKVYYPPEGERVSHFRPLRDFSRISLLNTVLVLVCIFWIWPRNFFRGLTKENIRKFYVRHISTSGDSNMRIACAAALGVFMGIIPIWGYQMIAAAALAHFLKLNKAVTLVASNISIPPMIPFILYGSYLTGCLILDVPSSLRPGDISLENTAAVLEQYIIGSFVLAAAAGVAAGMLSYVLLSIFRRGKRNG